MEEQRASNFGLGTSFSSTNFCSSVSHRVSCEHHAETHTSITSPDAVCVDGETIDVGEVSNDVDHGGSVVPEYVQMIDFAPLGVVAQEIIHSCRFIHVVLTSVTLG